MYLYLYSYSSIFLILYSFNNYTQKQGYHIQWKGNSD